MLEGRIDDQRSTTVATDAYNFKREEPLYISQLHKVTQARIWIFRRFLTERLRKDTHAKVEKAVYFSLVSPLDSNPDPKYKPCLRLKKHHDRLFVIDLEAAQHSLEFSSAYERECLVLRHISVRVLHKDQHPQRRIRKVRRSRIWSGETVSQEKESIRPRTAEGNLLA